MSDNAPSSPTPWHIRVWVAMAFAICLVSASVIYYSFMTIPETNCNIVVQGGREMEGRRVRVQRADGQTPAAPLVDVMNQENGYAARFFLNSGTYEVRVEDDRGRPVDLGHEFIPPGRRLSYDLRRRPGAFPRTR